MIEKMFYNQPIGDHDLPLSLHRRSTWSDDDSFHHHHQQRRPSSLTCYELKHQKERTLSKSTILPNRNSLPDPVSLSRSSVPPQRRSTIHRLNSSTSNDSNIVRIQSNEYTSITDGLIFHLIY